MLETDTPSVVKALPTVYDIDRDLSRLIRESRLLRALRRELLRKRACEQACPRRDRSQEGGAP